MTNFPVSASDILTAGYIIRKRNLIGYWTFNLQSLIDSSGNNRGLTLTGGSYTASGVSGYGVTLTGVSDYLTL